MFRRIGLALRTTGTTMTPLADTSVWVEALRQPDSWVRGRIEADLPIAYTEPVMMELLSGVRADSERSQTLRLLARGPLLPFDSAADFAGAATIYRAARRQGITPDSQVDCMIVAVAARSGSTLVTRDRLQADIARLFDVDVDVTA